MVSILILPVLCERLIYEAFHDHTDHCVYCLYVGENSQEADFNCMCGFWILTEDYSYVTVQYVLLENHLEMLDPRAVGWGWGQDSSQVLSHQTVSSWSRFVHIVLTNTNCWWKVSRTLLSKTSLYAGALRFPHKPVSPVAAFFTLGIAHGDLVLACVCCF